MQGSGFGYTGLTQSQIWPLPVHMPMVNVKDNVLMEDLTENTYICVCDRGVATGTYLTLIKDRLRNLLR